MGTGVPLSLLAEKLPMFKWVTATLIPCNPAVLIQYVRAEERTEDCVRLGSSGGKTRPNYSCYQD
jgi:hypothetical protein